MLRRIGAVLFATVAGTAVAALPAAAVDDVHPTSSHVVLIGTSGIQWSDITPENTPNLWALSGRSSVADVTVRSVRSYACPSDGWLAVNSGSRAADAPYTPVIETDPNDPNVSLLRPDRCRELSSPLAPEPGDTPAVGAATAAQAATASAATAIEPADTLAVPRWQQYVESASQSSYQPHLGLLGDTMSENGITTAAIGPGAAIALSNSQGIVAAPYADLPAGPAQITDLVHTMATAQLTVVDVGAVRDRTDRLTMSGSQVAALDAAQIADVDQRIGAVIAGLPSDATVIVASLADSGTTPRLQFMAMTGPEPYGLLGTTSTRQDGLVQTTDVLPTVLDLLDLSHADGVDSLGGAPIQTTKAPLDQQTRIKDVLNMSTAATVVRPMTGPFLNFVIFGGTALFAIVTVLWRVRASDRLLPAKWRPRAQRIWARTAQVIATAFAAMLVATTLANLLPWPQAGNPKLALQLAVLGWTAIIVAIAYAGPWRRKPIGPPLVVAAVTAVTLGVDVLTGATLQISALLGVQPLVAGRFYGFSNTSGPLFDIAVLFLTIAAVQPLLARGRRGLAVTVIAVVGLATTALVGFPSLGADFGGPPAIIPAFAIFAVLVAGLRLSWRRVLAIGGATVLAVAALCFADWLRPPNQRTHLGRFVQTVIDGGLWSVIGRKLSQNLSNLFGTWLIVVTVAGVLFVIFVLYRRTRFGLVPMRLVAETVTAVKAGVIAAAIMLTIGMLINDSGVLVPAVGLALGVNLLLGVCGGALALAPPGKIDAPSIEAGEAAGADEGEAAGQAEAQIEAP